MLEFPLAVPPSPPRPLWATGQKKLSKFSHCQPIYGHFRSFLPSLKTCFPLPHWRTHGGGGGGGLGTCPPGSRVGSQKKKTERKRGKGEERKKKGGEKEVIGMTEKKMHVGLKY